MAFTSYSTMVAAGVLMLLPVQFMLPSCCLFIFVCLAVIHLTLLYLPMDQIRFITVVVTLMITLQWLKQDYGFLWANSIVLLLLLFKFIIPADASLLIIDISTALIFVQILMPQFIFLALTLIFIFLLVKDEYSEYRAVFMCYFVYGLLVTSAFVIGLLLIPAAVFSSGDYSNINRIVKFVPPISELIGIKWKISQTSNIPKEKICVFVSNHQTIIDAVGMGYFIKEQNLKCTAAAQMLYFFLWPFGLLLWLSGVIFVNGNENRKLKILTGSLASLGEQKAHIWCFPEGGINPDPSKIQDFKKEAFSFAIQNSLPVVPIVFSPYHFVSWKEKRFVPGNITIQVLPALATSNVKPEELNDFMDKVHEEMSAAYEKLSAAIEL